MSGLDDERWLNLSAYQVLMAKARREAEELITEVADLPGTSQITKMAAATTATLEQLDAALLAYLEDK
jgi:hypothetical protein